MKRMIWSSIAMMACMLVIVKSQYASNTAAGNCVINMRAYANYGAASGLWGWMVVNGVVVYNVTQSTDAYAHRGVCTAIIDPVTCQVLLGGLPVCFDTQCCAQNSLDLSTYIQYLTKGTIIAGSSNDEPIYQILNAQPALRAIGANTYTLDWWSQFAFVAQMGYPQKTVFKRQYNNGGNNNSVVINVLISGTVGNIVLTQL